MTQKTPKLFPHFAVPIAELEVPDSGALCSRLTELFLEREAEGDRWRNPVRRNTQQGLFESQFDLFQWPDEPVRELARICHQALGAVVREANAYSQEEMEQMEFGYHSWFHLTRTGGFQGLHHHANASWSGIFCVDPGDPVVDAPLSGVVRFHNPHMPEMHADPGNSFLQMPYHSGSYQVAHRPGLLILFPSYLQHEIFPYLGQRPRIVVAFNAWMRWSGAPPRGAPGGQ
ncbi:MAG: 2OG-Fe(II) oxygenase family protein [Gammaproteobacteria bacterium]|jgi:hypothetical protein|nr:2OG-Fe(II) oxygenase family protein [Gammaproteobacteria bacterium]